jgi:hypothetical protein
MRRRGNLPWWQLRYERNLAFSVVHIPQFLVFVMVLELLWTINVEILFSTSFQEVALEKLHRLFHQVGNFSQKSLWSFSRATSWKEVEKRISTFIVHASSKTITNTKNWGIWTTEKARFRSYLNCHHGKLPRRRITTLKIWTHSKISLFLLCNVGFRWKKQAYIGSNKANSKETI